MNATQSRWTRRLALIGAGYGLLAAVAVGQVQMQVLQTQNALPAVFFGSSVDLEGDLAVIGAACDVSPLVGSAYIFRRVAGSWIEEAQLLPADGAGGDLFGFSISISGTTVLVGAPGKSAAYVFEQQGSAWVQTATLTPVAGHILDKFGWSVSLRDDVALVGAPFDDVQVGDQGSVTAFRRTSSGWVLWQEIPGDDPTPGARFGASIDIWQDLAVVSATFSSAGRGRAFLLRETPTGWVRFARLEEPDSPSVGATTFGEAAALWGDTAVVTAPNASLPTAMIAGAAYVYERQGGLWIHGGTLLASDGEAWDRFGRRAILQGNVAFVTTWDADMGRGAAYLFERQALGWTEVAKLTGSTTQPGDQFGTSVALDASTAMIGAVHHIGAAPGTGAVYVFDIPIGQAVCAATSNSTGVPAHLTTFGSTSVSRAALDLIATPVPDDVGLFFYGPEQTQVPFGNGFLCVAGFLSRLPPQQATGGILRHSVDFDDPPTAQGQILPGTSWNFQAWFRDPGAGGAAFNLSDARHLIFSL